MKFFKVGLLLLGSAVVSVADPLGWFEQKFSAINFETHKWTRTLEPSCRVYTAVEDGAHVDVLRIGTNNLVAFRATKGLKVSICGSTASFDEGFDALGNVVQPAR